MSVPNGGHAEQKAEKGAMGTPFGEISADSGGILQWKDCFGGAS